MPTADTQTIVAALAAAFPNAKLHRETIAVYVRALADIPPEELEPVAKAHMLEAAWFPTVRDLRRAVVEARLQLPSSETAWGHALECATDQATVRCPAGCENGVLPGGDPIELDPALADPIEDDYLRGLLGRVVKAAARPVHICDTCSGAGTIPNPRRRQLAEPVQRALDHVGGDSAIRQSENLGILRAQFLKAYDRTREEAIRAENLGSAGLALHSPRPMLEP